MLELPVRPAGWQPRAGAARRDGSRVRAGALQGQLDGHPRASSSRRASAFISSPSTGAPPDSACRSKRWSTRSPGACASSVLERALAQYVRGARRQGRRAWRRASRRRRRRWCSNAGAPPGRIRAPTPMICSTITRRSRGRRMGTRCSECRVAGEFARRVGSGNAQPARRGGGRCHRFSASRVRRRPISISSSARWNS